MIDNRGPRAGKLCCGSVKFSWFGEGHFKLYFNGYLLDFMEFVSSRIVVDKEVASR